MAKTISLRNAKVMYYDGKIIPIEFTGTMSNVRFISNNTSMKVMFVDRDADLDEKAAKFAICMKTYNKAYRFAEVGSLIECMRYYGLRIKSNNKYLMGMKDAVKDAKHGSEIDYNAIMEYCNDTQLTEQEFVELAAELNKSYSLTDDRSC